MTKVGKTSSRVIYFFHSVVLQLITDAVNVLLRNFSNLDYKKDKWKIGWLTSQRKKARQSHDVLRLHLKCGKLPKFLKVIIVCELHIKYGRILILKIFCHFLRKLHYFWQNWWKWFCSKSLKAMRKNVSRNGKFL